MWFLVGILGYFLGNFFIGAPLTFVFNPEQRDNPDSENIYGKIGGFIGSIIAISIYLY
jgi:hypothetical protein